MNTVILILIIVGILSALYYFFFKKKKTPKPQEPPVTEIKSKFYRINQIDKDRKSSYSTVIKIN